jgi:hypothetical protein
MINCGKVRLPLQICNFLCFRGFTYGCQAPVRNPQNPRNPRFHAPVWNPGFLCLESAFFFFCLSRPRDCSDCDLERLTVSLAELPQHPGKFLQEWARLPHGQCDTCQLLIGRPRFEAYSACHMAKLDKWYHLIGPRGNSCHVSSADWSVPFFYSCRSWHVAYTSQILIGRSTLIELLIGRSKGL